MVQINRLCRLFGAECVGGLRPLFPFFPWTDVQIILDGLDGEAGVRAGASAPCSEGIRRPSLPPRVFIHRLGLEAVADRAIWRGAWAGTNAAALCRDSGVFI